MLHARDKSPVTLECVWVRDGHSTLKAHLSTLNAQRSASATGPAHAVASP